MKKILFLALLMLVSTTVAHARGGARNFTVNTYQITTDAVTTVTPNITGTFWIQTDQKIYLNLESSATPNTTTGLFLLQNQDRDMWPLRFRHFDTAATELGIIAASATANVNIIWYDE